MSTQSRTYRTETTDSSNNATSLEPRIARMETSVSNLTDTMRELAGTVHDNVVNVDRQLQSLAIAVTQASGPRRTDWGTVISAIFLILAIGSAAFWPLNQTSQNTKNDMKELQIKCEQHISQDSQAALNQRLMNIEANMDRINAADLLELRAWRNKASGLSMHDMSVPLQIREMKPQASK